MNRKWWRSKWSKRLPKKKEKKNGLELNHLIHCPMCNELMVLSPKFILKQSTTFTCYMCLMCQSEVLVPIDNPVLVNGG